jgi:hypothetical protein
MLADYPIFDSPQRKHIVVLNETLKNSFQFTFFSASKPVVLFKSKIPKLSKII